MAKLKKIIIPAQYCAGDYAEIKCIYNEDITGFNIRAQIYDRYKNFLLKATSEVEGGSSTQISITDGVNGKFSIYLLNNETIYFNKNSILEIELQDLSSNRFSVYNNTFVINSKRLTWDSQSNPANMNVISIDDVVFTNG